MKKSVIFIFVAFIMVSSFIRFLSVDHFDTDNVSIVASSILSSRLDDRYQCIVNYDEELRTSVQNCDVIHGSVPSNTLRECKVEAHMSNSENLSRCLEITGVSVPEPIVETTAPMMSTKSASVDVIAPASKIVVAPEPEPEPEPEPQPPCDELSCYMNMLDYHNKVWGFDNVRDFISCKNCPEETYSTFRPLPGVSDQHSDYNWSDPVTFPGNNADNYSNYCKWGLVNGWCSREDFSGACRNECASS
jgi:hypothetical protein